MLYKGKSGAVLTCADETGQECTYRAEIGILQYLAKTDSAVKNGDWVKLELVQVGNEWVAMKIGPGTKPATFQTGKDILQQNIEAVKMAPETPKSEPVTQLPKEAEKVEKKGDNVAPVEVLSATGGVELAIHVNLGNYSSFDLKVTGINGEHARQLLQQEAAPTIVLAKGIIQEASKGY